jgi:serine/threonine protein kinase
MRGSWVGETLGNVKIETLIARGGMAEVYLGTHITLQRKVAVKIMRNPSDENSDDLDRFKREARVVASLRHPNIVQVDNFDMVDNDPYLVMEYVDGPSLSTYLHYLQRNHKKLQLPHVVRMLGHVANALQYAHNNNIVHRDVKPGNILLTSPTQRIELNKPLPDDFVPVLTDFGLIRFLDSARQTTTGVTAGTPAYMSPEQAQGLTTDARTDVYSLGVVLYEMLAGRIPFDGETTVSILLKHVNEPPAPIPGLSPFMQDVLNHALAKKRENRFRTPATFAKAFIAAVDINPPTIQMAALPSKVHPRLQTVRASKAKQPKRSVWNQLAIVGIPALVLGAFLFFIGRASASVTNAGTLTENPSALTNARQISSDLLDLETSLVLHFRDENAFADHAFLEVNRVPAPPTGNNYEVWLFNENEQISLGILPLNDTGNGQLIFTDNEELNLIATYDQVKITLEPEVDTNPAPTSRIAFAFSLPPEDEAHIRYLLSSSPNLPDESGLIHGLYNNIEKINELAGEMDNAYAIGNESLTRQSAESIINLIVGDQSPDYKDWNQDGFITDESDGYGLDLNGDNLGYFVATFIEADKAVKSSNASQPILRYGEILKTCVQNLKQWAPELNELTVAILEAPFGTDLREQIVDVNNLAGQMLNGVDQDGDGTIASTIGECGANFAYVYAYAMADMPLESTGLVPDIGTSTSTADTSNPTEINNTGSGSVSTQTPGFIPPD